MIVTPLCFAPSTNPLEGYRSIALNWGELFTMTKGTVLSASIIYAKNTFLCAITSITLLILIGKPQNTSQLIRCVVYILYPFISLEYQINHGNIQSIWDWRFFLLCGGLIIYLLTVAYDIVIKITDRNVKLQILNYFILCILSLAPFCIVQPFSDRCVYLSYVFSCMMILTALRYAITQRTDLQAKMRKSCRYILAALLLFLTVEFVHVGKWDYDRTIYIENSMKNGDKTITIYEIPSQFTYKTWLIHKLYYYNISGDIEFTVVDYETWLNAQYTG